MTFILPLLLLVVFAACVGVLYPEGLWSNAVRLINVVTAALVATNFFEPVARWLDGMADSFTYFWDFIALWGLFCVAMVVMRVATDLISRVKVRFLKIVDRVGGAVFAVLVGWAMVCFVTMTLHTAPLAKGFLFGGFDPSRKMFFGLAPDRQWLSFVQHVSKGPFSWSEPKVFDPSNEFMVTYNNRRAALDKQREEKKAFLVKSGEAPKR
jgi:uncharacterized membrane protein required for colicin V production